MKLKYKHLNFQFCGGPKSKDPGPSGSPDHAHSFEMVFRSITVWAVTHSMHINVSARTHACKEKHMEKQKKPPTPSRPTLPGLQGAHGSFKNTQKFRNKHRTNGI